MNDTGDKAAAAAAAALKSRKQIFWLSLSLGLGLPAGLHDARQPRHPSPLPASIVPGTALYVFEPIETLAKEIPCLTPAWSSTSILPASLGHGCSALCHCA
jgi:hypothetical protein